MNDEPGGCSAIERLLQGAATFHRDVFPARRELFEELSRGQAPHTLFITCADSRVSPSMITQTAPGELFVMRNIGNIVPSYGEMLGGVSAVVEYAVAALNVNHIIVCGHTDCGAMKALANPEASGLNDMPTVKSWLHNAVAAQRVANAVVGPDAPGEAMMRALIEQNVLLQLTHLRTHPAVAARLAQDGLSIHGWVYDIGEGRIAVIDEATRRSVGLDEAREMLRAGVRAA